MLLNARDNPYQHPSTLQFNRLTSVLQTTDCKAYPREHYTLKASGYTFEMQQLRHITDNPGVLMKLSLLDRFLPVWIIGAMALGILLGYFVPAVERTFNGVQIVDVSLPIAIGWVLCTFLYLAFTACVACEGLYAMPPRVRADN